MDFITPLYELPETEVPGCRIFIKRDDLLPFSLGGNKVRIAQALIDDMKNKNCDVLVGYGNVRSNLCRVLANQCRTEGIPCHIICSHEEQEDTSAETSNSRLMELLGAVLIPCRKDAIAETVDRVMKGLENQGRRPYYIYGDRYGRGNEGTAAGAYAKAWQEIRRQEKELGVVFDLVFLASGTGATQSGLICGSLLDHSSADIIGISVSRDRERGTEILRDGVQSYFRLCGLPLPENAFSRIHLEDGYRKGGYGRYDEEILSLIRRMFQNFGIPMDPTYTGKAYAGMLRFLKEHSVARKNILFLHTGGTPLFYDALNAGLLNAPV